MTKLEADFGTSFYCGFPKSTRGSDFENLNWDFASDLLWQFSKLSSLRDGLKKWGFWDFSRFCCPQALTKIARSWFSLPRGNEKTNFVIFVSAWGQQILGVACMLICHFPLTCSSSSDFLFHLTFFLGLLLFHMQFPLFSCVSHSTFVPGTT